MLFFLAPTTLLTKAGIHRAFYFIHELISSTHEDPFLSLVSTKFSEMYFSFQVLHLVAQKSYRPLLEYIMAAYCTHIVSACRHLLAMDLPRDYRGNRNTTREFNYDAYHVSCLFHKCPVPADLFRPFVQWQPRSRRDAHEKLKYLKSCRDLGQWRVRAAAPPRPQDSHSLVRLIEKMPSHVLMTKAMTVLRVVAVAQDIDVLQAALKRYREVHGDNRMESLALRYFIIGPDMGDGRQRLWLGGCIANTPLQVLRRLAP